MRTYIFYLIAILLTGFSAFAGGKHPPSGSTQQSSQTDKLDFTMPEDFTFEYDFFETVKAVGCKMTKDGNNILLDMDWAENDVIEARRILFKYTGTVWEVWLNHDPNKSESLTKMNRTFKDLYSALGSQAKTQYVAMLVANSRESKIYKVGKGEFEGIPCDMYSMKKDGPVHFYVAPGTTFCLTMGWWTVNKKTGQQVWASEVQPKSFSTASTDLSSYR